ncbi:DNA primase [Dolosicoccus paucivorans]|uniref:DNA primase n=1 Tax=Dolosicoccus paucivorans TaxID=84521 RepID=UPI000887A8E5|nr:DNA primase [Dolosicoccus paucivorans]SDI48218.1 DNA primase [Dolosicoccus paucivorans]
MAFIPPQKIEEIQQKTDITQVIGKYTRLSQSGKNFVASCPFHEDRNPSFSVDKAKQLYHCFSCGRGGNVFNFLQEIEHINFVEAVKRAAEISHVPLDAEYLQERPLSSQDILKKRLLLIHQKVTDFYCYYLQGTQNGVEALDYLTKRQFTQETMESFQIGLAPHSSKILVQVLQQEEFTTEELIESGIFYLNNDNELIDRFRGRIIFPLRNVNGEVVGFSGRVYEQTSDLQQAKYLNSPNTAIFNKSHHLFNLDKATPTIRQTKQVLIAEGFMDVIALHQAKVENTVATMGTSLSSTHLQRLEKIASEVVLIFDGDKAGQQATDKAYQLGLNYDKLTFKNITIPMKMDPDEWIKEKGVESFQALIHQSDDMFSFYESFWQKDFDLSIQQELAQYIERLLVLVAQVSQSAIEVELKIQSIAQKYSIPVETLMQTYQTIQLPLAQSNAKENLQQPKKTVSKLSTATNLVSGDVTLRSKAAFFAEKQILFYLIYYPQAWEYLNEQFNGIPFILIHEHSQSLYFILEEAYYNKHNPVQLPMTELDQKINDETLKQLFISIRNEYQPLGFVKEVMSDCLTVLDREFIQLEIDELRQQANQLAKLKQLQEASELYRQIQDKVIELKSL